MQSVFKAQLPSLLPWMAGGSIAFLVRLAASFGGMDGYNADAMAMYLFLSLSVMILAWSHCVPLLLRDCEARSTYAMRVLPLLTLCMASAMTGIFVFLLVRDF